MAAQDVNWALHVFNFDHLEAIRAALSDKQGLFAEGMAALAYYNDPTHAPWAVKDPRLCITLKFWMAFWKTPPAVLFVYRHPIEVRVCVLTCVFEGRKAASDAWFMAKNPRMSKFSGGQIACAAEGVRSDEGDAPLGGLQQVRYCCSDCRRNARSLTKD